MRILFATDHAYLPYRVGGAECSTHELCLALGLRGIRTAVLARRDAPPGREVGRLEAGRWWLARRVHYPVYRRDEPEASVAEVVRRFRPSVAVVGVGRPMALARAFLREGVPTSLYLRDVQLRDPGGETVRDPRVTWLANSAFAAARIRDGLGVEVTVVPPLVLPRRHRTRPRGESVLFVNPVPVKGFETAARLVASRPDVPFDFVEGWPVFGRRRRHWAEALGDAPNVRWHASVLDMRPFYARARVLLVPSLAVRGVWEEGWGRVVTEAHTSGIPVLASRSGGLPEAVGPGGILLDADAPPEAWAKALSRLWDDPHEHAAFARAARAWADRAEIRPDALVERFLGALAR